MPPLNPPKKPVVPTCASADSVAVTESVSESVSAADFSATAFFLAGNELHVH